LEEEKVAEKPENKKIIFADTYAIVKKSFCAGLY
jgi:hypothetical protein